MNSATPKHMTASLGGAFIMDTIEDDEAREQFASWYGDIGYVFINLPDGTRMQLFYNCATRLFVADIIAADETGGNEFVRKTVPSVSSEEGS